MEADPIPESPWGTEPTTEFVAVGSRSPAPRPISSMPGTTPRRSWQALDAAETCHSPPAIAARPAATVNFIPMKRATTGDSGALDDEHGGDGQDTQPGLQR